MPKASKKKSAPHRENKAYGSQQTKSASNKVKKSSSSSSTSTSTSTSTSKPPSKLPSKSSSTSKPSSSHKKKLTKHAPLEQQLITTTGDANYAQIESVIDQFRKKKDEKEKEKNKKKKEEDDDDIVAASDDDDMADDTTTQQAMIASLGDDDDEEDIDEKFISADMSKRILQVAHEQIHEDDDEKESKSKAISRTRARMISLRTDEDEDEDDAEIDPDEEEEDVEEVELSAEDERSLSMFLPESTGVRRTLADIIMDKIREKEEADAKGNTEGTEHMVKQRMDPKVVQVYSQVGKYLSHYSSGKIPKAFKIVPTLKNWEEVLYLTHPDGWTPQSMYVATRLFASNLNPKMAQRFYNLVLLPRIRRDLETRKVLNYHLYQSVKKALYKPPAFFKGLLLPMVEEGCSVREGVIMSSILAKCSIPVLHAAVAILKLTQIPYSGPTILFIKTLVNKKYSLPYKVIDALVSYFCSFTTDTREMPVIWHQCLLVFVQRYRQEFSSTQRNALKALLRAQTHHTMTAEIRHQLIATDATSTGSGGQRGNTRPINHSSNLSSVAASPAMSLGAMEFD